jgi:hypothetical protein
MFWVFYLTPYLPYILSPCNELKSYDIAIFALDLKTTYEEEHTIFGLLSLSSTPVFLVFFWVLDVIHDVDQVSFLQGMDELIFPKKY